MGKGRNENHCRVLQTLLLSRDQQTDGYVYMDATGFTEKNPR